MFEQTIFHRFGWKISQFHKVSSPLKDHFKLLLTRLNSTKGKAASAVVLNLFEVREHF